MSGFSGKIRHLAWADFPPLDWESWVLELSSGNAIDVACQPQSGVLTPLAEDRSMPNTINL